jgi:hypothetical protein
MFYILLVASVKALYEYLLNREYAEPLALEQTMERKGVRSPSMRLRFGRRSDPDVPLITRVRNCSFMCTPLNSLTRNFFVIKTGQFNR